MQRFLFVIILFSISAFTTYKSYLAQKVFREKNIPIYDGVSYEKRQIETFERFKNNFSFWKKKVEIPIEFNRLGHGSGFNSAVILFNPIWLSNDYDVVIRGFLSLFIFSLIFFKFLKSRMNEIKALLFILLFFNFPLFYNYRYGVTTYIPEIPSALILLAGYIQFLIFFKSQKLIYFALASVLIISPMFFRLNFFVFSGLFVFPLIYKSYLIFKIKNLFGKTFMISVTIFCLSVYFFYVHFHLNFFLDYYVKEVAYDAPNRLKSILSFFDNFNSFYGLIGLISLILMIVFVNKQEFSTNWNEKLLISYPFLFHFSFVMIYLGAINTPHVLSAMAIFFILICTNSSELIHSFSKKVSDKLLIMSSVLCLIALNINFVLAYNNNNQTFPEYKASKNVIEFIKRDKELNKSYKYLCLYYEIEEVPIDVQVYKETGFWLNSKDHFFFHDTWYYDYVDKNLCDTTCANFYIKKIESQDFNLIVINDSIYPDIAQYPLASRVNKMLMVYLKNSNRYKPVNYIKTAYHGGIIFYKRK